MNNVTYEWVMRGNKWYYYDCSTKKIVGAAHRQALGDIWISLVYTGVYTFTIDDERHLGQYVDESGAKDAVSYYWDRENRTLLAGPEP